MNKQQNKILAIVYQNADEGITLDDISKKTKLSKISANMEIASLIELNAIKECPGQVFKPSSGKLKMMT